MRAVGQTSATPCLVPDRSAKGGRAARYAACGKLDSLHAVHAYAPTRRR